MDTLRFPIGLFVPPSAITPHHVQTWIDEIEAAPAELRRAVTGMDEIQLNTQYRPNGWTVQQVVHHLVDSHINSYVRFKLAVTEDNPMVKPYDEASWAELDDGKSWPIEDSLKLLDLLHARLVAFLRSMTPAQVARTFQHPERGTVRVDETIGLYAWHGKHHIAHITNLKSNMGW